jgi:hypothetical protein
MPGSLLNFTRLAFAGGHDEQPWLVNSSTTVGDWPAVACVNPRPKNVAGATRPNAIEIFMAMLPDGLPLTNFAIASLFVTGLTFIWRAPVSGEEGLCQF